MNNTNILLLMLVISMIYSCKKKDTTPSEPMDSNNVGYKYYSLPATDVYATDVLATKDGGLLIYGFAGNSRPELNLLLKKIDSDFNEVWSKSYGGSNEENSTSIIDAGDGNYLLLGQTYSAGAGLGDINVIKVDGQGNEVWNKTYGTSENDYGSSIITLSTGEFMIVGHTKGITTNDDFYVVKINVNGDKLWDKTFGSTEYEYGQSMVETDNGDLIAVGYQDNFIAGLTSSYIIKFDSQGNELWSKSVQGDYSWRAINGTDGDVFIAGSNDDKTFSFQKIDFDGQSLAYREHGGNQLGHDHTSGIIELNGNIYISGFQEESISNPNGSGLLLRTNKDGSEKWLNTYSENVSYGTTFNSVISYDSDKIIVCGDVTGKGTNQEIVVVILGENGEIK